MALIAPARGSGSLLAGLDVVVLDRASATLCAAWWLTELGARVGAPPPGPVGTPDGPPDGLAAIAARRLTPGRPTAPTYAIRSGRAGPAVASVPDGTTVLTLVDPTAAGTPELPGWSGAAAWALSGMASLTTSIRATDRSDRLRVPADDHAVFIAGTFGVVVLLAVDRAAGAGRPRPATIEVDLQEVLTAFIQQPVAAAQLDVAAVPSALRAPGGVKQAADGLVFVQAVEPAHWGRIIDKAGGVDGLHLSSPPLMAELIDNRARIDAALDGWLTTASVTALVDELQDEHIPAAPVSRPVDMLADGHLRDRHFFERGEPTVSWIRTSAGATRGATPVRPASTCRPPSTLPLDGLRVLDLTWAWAGPYATTILADLGAEVINIEWWPRPSNLRTQNPTVAPGTPDGCGWWSANQRGKLSVGVDLKTEQGVQVVRDLAAVADVAVENFSDGVAERLGVGAAALQQVNPALVYASVSAFGSSGPHAHWIGYGTQLLAASGMSRAMMAPADDVALMGIPYPDPLSGLTAALGVLAAVGRGAARLDVSMLEATCLAIAGSIGSAAGARRRGWVPTVVECAYGERVLVARPDGAPAPQSAPSAAELTATARPAGGDAVVVATPASVLHDDRLTGRRFWRPDLAPLLHATGVVAAGPPLTLDGERPTWWRGAPDLFQDTAAVLRDVLHYEADHIDSLAACGAVAVGADAPASGR